MKSIKTVIICVVLFLAERVLFANFSLFSVTPWLMLAFLFDLSVMSEEADYLPLYAALCGFLTDVASGGNMGVNTAVFPVMCLLLNRITSVFLKNGFLMGMTISFVAYIIADVFCIMLNGIGLSGAFIHLILPQAIINTAFSALLYLPVKKLYFPRRVLV